MARYATYVCGPSACPVDTDFEHDDYYGCVPKDFKPSTGRSKTHHTTRMTDPGSPLGYRYRWNGGCSLMANEQTANPSWGDLDIACGDKVRLYAVADGRRLPIGLGPYPDLPTKLWCPEHGWVTVSDEEFARVKEHFGGIA